MVATLPLAGCLPAAAQNLLLPARTAPANVPAFSARLRFPPLAASPSDPSILATGIPADYPGQSLASAAQSLMESVATPFLHQRRVSFASLAGGHLELKCFEALEPMESILLGPPAFAGSTAVGVGTQAQHPGMWVPLSRASYGLTLSFNLKGDSGSDHSAGFWGCLGRILGGRACHAN